MLLGRTDDPALNPACPGLLKRLETLALERIVTSDLRRAKSSAQLLADRRALPLSTDPRWRELDFGAWDGLAPAHLPEEALERFWADPQSHPPPDGERWSDLLSRVGKAIGDISGTTLVFTHAGAMRAALSLLTGLDHRGVWALDLPHGALLTLRVWPGDSPAAQVIGLRTEGDG